MDVYSRTALRFAIIAAFGGFIFGLDAALISGTIKYITQQFSLSDIQLGTVVSAPGFGVIFALLATGPLCNRLGRKKTLLIISLIYLASAIASMLAPNYEFLVFARFLGGLAFTSLSLSSMYIGEIAPPQMRGKLVAMNQIVIVVGLSSAYFSNYFLVNLIEPSSSLASNIWRLMLGVEVLPAALWFLLILTLPESPRWLISQKRIDEAKRVMAKLMPIDNIQPTLTDILSSAPAMQNLNENFHQQFRSLFDSKVRTALIVGIVFAIVQPVTGINAILFYAPMVFEQTGIGTNASFLQTLTIGLVSIVFTFLAILLIDKVGRRPLVIIGLSSSAAFLFLCFWSFDNATYTLSLREVDSLLSNPVFANYSFDHLIDMTFHSDIEFKAAMNNVLGDELARNYESEFIKTAVSMNVNAVMFGILGFIGSFHFSVGPIMWVVFSEIVPTRIRGIAIPFFALISSILSFCIQQFFPWQLNNLGAANIFLFYCIAALIGLFLLFIFLPETKNKSIEEIEVMLASHDKLKTPRTLS